MKSQVSLDELRVRTAEALAEAFNQSGFNYIIVNGLYGYPDGIGRDIDILIRPENAPTAIFIADNIRKTLGWDSLLLRWSPYGTWQLFFVLRFPDRLAWLEVDLMHRRTMLIGAASLVDNFEELIDHPDQFCGPFPISRVGGYIKAQLRPILYGDLVRFESKYALEPVKDAQIENYLRRLLGLPVAKRYCEATQAGVSGVRGIGRSLRWAMNQRSALRHPVRAICNGFWSRFIRPIQLYGLTEGMVFAVVGPDYPEKQAALQQTIQYLNGCFDVRIKTFKPELRSLPCGGKGSPHIGWCRHWIQILYDFFALIWEYYVKDRFMPKSVIQFVLYNGGTLNMTIDPARYNLRSGAGLRLLRWILPKPAEFLLIDNETGIPGCNLEAMSASQIETVAKWRELILNAQEQIVVRKGNSTAETGRRLAASILQEIDRRFSLAKSKDLKRETLKYGLTNPL